LATLLGSSAGEKRNTMMLTSTANMMEPVKIHSISPPASIFRQSSHDSSSLAKLIRDIIWRQDQRNKKSASIR
jgi:hypothetical protein